MSMYFSKREMFPFGIDKFNSKIEAFRSDIINWAEDTQNNGWQIASIYNNVSIDDSAKLSRDGWQIHIFNRKEYIAIFVWSPDGLSLQQIPQKYSMEALELEASRCHFCGEFSHECRRVAFANRACPKCLEQAKKKLEYPGWCD